MEPADIQKYLIFRIKASSKRKENLRQTTRRCKWSMTGSRRLAGMILGRRRRGKRSRSAKDGRTMDDGVASGHGRRRTEGRQERQGRRRRQGGQGHGYDAQRTAVRRTETKFSGRRQVQYFVRGALTRGTETCPRFRAGQAREDKPAVCRRCCARRASRPHTAVPRACPNDRAQT